MSRPDWKSLTIGQRMRILSAERKLSQKDIAEACGFHTSTVSQWFNDRQTPREFDACKKIATFLGVSTEELFG